MQLHKGLNAFAVGDSVVDGTVNSNVYLDASGNLKADGVLLTYGDTNASLPLAGFTDPDPSTATTVFRKNIGQTTPYTGTELVLDEINITLGAVEPGENGYQGYQWNFTSGGITGNTNEPLIFPFAATYTGHASDDAGTSYGVGFASVTKNGGSSDATAFTFIGPWDAHTLATEDITILAFNLFGNAAGPSVTISAGDAGTGGNDNGGDVLLASGAKDGSGSTGNVVASIPEVGGFFQVQVNSTAITRTFDQGLFPVTDGKQVAVGRITSNAQVTAAGTDLLTVSTDDAIQRYDFAAGTGSYTYNIDLANGSEAIEGATFELYISKDNSPNPTINIRNGSGGSNLISINDANTESWYVVCRHDGTNWVRQTAIINDL